MKLVPNEQVVDVDEFETEDPALRGEMTIAITLADADGGLDLHALHDGLPAGPFSLHCDTPRVPATKEEVTPRAAMGYRPCPMAVVVVLVLLILVAGFLSNQAKAAAATKLEDAAEAFLTTAMANKRLVPIAVGATLKKKEEGYYQENAALYEPRAMRHYKGGGTSVRVMKGLSVRSSAGESFSTQELTKLDKGSLMVTNMRVIFAGVTEHRSLDIAKIDAVTVMKDGVRISVSNRSKPVSFSVPNPWLLAGLVGLLQHADEHLLPSSES